MSSFLQRLQQAFSSAIQISFPELGEKENRADISPCGQDSFGHYQCNSALRLAKHLQKKPTEIAQKILEALDEESKKMIAHIEIAGPGFLNITLFSDFISTEVQALLKDPLLGVSPIEKRERIVVEFSSPNVAKELHVGHLRSTIIGDCLARLFEFLGHDVIRLNHIGDWGTQFGMLIVYMKAFAPKVLRGEEQADLSSLMDWYKAAKQRFDVDQDFKKRSQLEVVKLQSGEEEPMNAWEMISEISRRGFQEIYNLLDVRISERGESFYNPYLSEIVTELESKKLVTESDGAKCIYLEGFVNREGESLPLIVQKSDGGFNYNTTDLAAIRHRIFEERAERVIYVTDIGQSLHFQMVFKTAEKAGWLEGPDPVELEHVGFGLVLGSDGKKFKTRSGDTEKLIDLLREAVERARQMLMERLPVSSREEIEHLAKVLGIGAVKYADLACLRSKDYTFSYDKMLRFEGNTAIFLLYAFVRIQGIKRKTHADIEKIQSLHTVSLKHPSEILLGLHLKRFGEVIEHLARDLLPNRLCEYLYELAEKFNAFFRDCRVEGSAEEGSRLLLCEITSRILEKGLQILGLETVERM